MTQRHEGGKTRNLPLRRRVVLVPSVLHFHWHSIHGDLPGTPALAISLMWKSLIYRLGDGRVDGFSIVSALPTQLHKRGVIALADCPRRRRRRSVASADLTSRRPGIRWSETRNNRALSSPIERIFCATVMQFEHLGGILCDIYVKAIGDEK